MGLHVTIDTGATVAAAGQIEELAKVMTEKINHVYSTVDNLAQFWSGESAARYNSTMQSFKQDYLDFAKAAEEMGEEFKNKGQNYANLEDSL